MQLVCPTFVFIEVLCVLGVLMLMLSVLVLMFGTLNMLGLFGCIHFV